MKRKILILGAAGRDFHNFNTFFRNNLEYEVVAFTATQIPHIEDRLYPPSLSGALYPNGIPIFSEDELTQLIVDYTIEECIFAYSDVSYQKVMRLGSIVNAAGAAFTLLSPAKTMLRSSKPVISVCAVRTGVGKSQTARKIIEILMEMDLKVVAIRHPMPYGELDKQRVQRFAALEDLDVHKCTLEEREEYEPHIVRGNVIYAGVDYREILSVAENDPAGCDVILWDGGNNDFSFFQSDLYITLLDPHRAGDEFNYYPSEVNLRMADVVIINKIDSAPKHKVEEVKANIKKVNPCATRILAESQVRVQNQSFISGKRVLVVEDGPSLTHGGMKIGAGSVAAQQYGALERIDPRPYAVGELIDVFTKYPHLEGVLPAMGYGSEQLLDLEKTINQCPCDAVIIGTPIDLGRIIKINKPYVRVHYDLKEVGTPDLNSVLTKFVKKSSLL